MTKKTLLAFILAVMAGAAFAAPPAFEAVDTNSDGMISITEAEAVEGLNFDEADTNGDGNLDRAEYQAAAERM